MKGHWLLPSTNEWSITRDTSKFRKLYESAPLDDEEIHEAESDTNEESDQDEDDVKQNNAQIPRARSERERQTPAWLRDYET